MHKTPDTHINAMFTLPGYLAQRLAHKLLFDTPSKAYKHYGGFSNALRISIQLAEQAHATHGEKGLLGQYGSATIINEMVSLQKGLARLAQHGPQAITSGDRTAFSMAKVTLDSLIRQSLITAEANRPGRKEPLPDIFLSPESDDYWHIRIHRLGLSEEQHAGEQTAQGFTGYSHYLLDVQRRLSAICHELGIHEIPNRPRLM